MAKPYGDDLRQKFLSAYDQGDISLRKLAALFHVSLGWAKKVSAARNRGGRRGKSGAAKRTSRV